MSTGIACRVLDRRSGHIPVDGCGLQGEIGHLPSVVSIGGEQVDLPCDCGVRGHVASYSSGPGIRRLAAVLRERRPREWRRSELGRRTGAGIAFEDAFAAALDGGDDVAGDLLAAATQPVADVLRTAMCLDPEVDLLAFTGGVAVALGAHYRAALLGHLRARGLYLTSEHAPDWVPDRVHVCATTAADCLAGAGLAAVAAEELIANGTPGDRAIGWPGGTR